MCQGALLFFWETLTDSLEAGLQSRFLLYARPRHLAPVFRKFPLFQLVASATMTEPCSLFFFYISCTS